MNFYIVADDDERGDGEREHRRDGLREMYWPVGGIHAARYSGAAHGERRGRREKG